MSENMLEELKRTLDLELESQDLAPVPASFYSKVSAYSQRLKRSSASGTSEASLRLISAQVHLIESMCRELLETRARKSRDQGSSAKLLPEERYICTPEAKSTQRLAEMLAALTEGQPSFVEFARKAENERAVVVRFTKKVDELVGFDMGRYGPFEPEDVATLPAASAEVLVSGGAAVEVHLRDAD